MKKLLVKSVRNAVWGLGFSDAFEPEMVFDKRILVSVVIVAIRCEVEVRVKRGVVRGRKAHERVSETDQGKDLRQMPLH